MYSLFLQYDYTSLCSHKYIYHAKVFLQPPLRSCLLCQIHIYLYRKTMCFTKIVFTPRPSKLNGKRPVSNDRNIASEVAGPLPGSHALLVHMDNPAPAQRELTPPHRRPGGPLTSHPVVDPYKNGEVPQPPLPRWDQLDLGPYAGQRSYAVSAPGRQPLSSTGSPESRNRQARASMHQQGPDQGNHHLSGDQRSRIAMRRSPGVFRFSMPETSPHSLSPWASNKSLPEASSGSSASRPKSK